MSRKKNEESLFQKKYLFGGGLGLCGGLGGSLGGGLGGGSSLGGGLGGGSSLGGGLGGRGGWLGLLASCSITESSHGTVDARNSLFSQNVVTSHGSRTSGSLVARSNSLTTDLIDSLQGALSRNTRGVTAWASVTAFSSVLDSISASGNNSHCSSERSSDGWAVGG